MSLDELLSNSDIVSLHLPMTEKTSGMVDGAFLQKMNQTAVLINTAHCGLVAEADLEEHLKENTGFKYAADTFEE